MSGSISTELVHAIIFTMIDDLELPAVLHELNFRCHRATPKPFRATYNYEFPNKHNIKLKVKVRSIGQAGNQFAAMETIDALHRFNPRFVFLCGIAGAMRQKDDLKLGDVVVSRQIDTVYFDKDTDS